MEPSGLEPLTICVQNRYSTELSYSPLKYNFIIIRVDTI